MVAGNTVIVLPGTYYTDLVNDPQVQVTKSGASGAPITYLAEGLVKMKGFAVSADYVTIKGFDIVTLQGRATASTWIRAATAGSRATTFATPLWVALP